MTTPKHRMKKFKLPDDCDAKEIVMRQLDGNDDLEIAIWADRRMTSAHKENIFAVIEVKKHEAARRALVLVDGKPVNEDGIPFAEMDNWSQQTMVYVLRGYNKLNGVEDDDLKKFDKSEEDYLLETSAS